MRLFSYRNRTRLRRFLVGLLSVLLALALISWGALVYLDRYIVYDHDGAHLDFHWQDLGSTAPDVTAPSVDAQISYVSADDDAALTGTRKVTGYYVTTDMLKNLDAVESVLSTGSYYAVLLDLRDSYGNFYYPSSVSGAQAAASVDTQAVRSLIDTLARKGVYLIARIPAFADQRHCLNNTDLGLPLSSGALWADSSGCYWMDPANPQVIDYLESICTELQSMGFQEVVLKDYQFPDTDAIVYNESEVTKDQVLSNTAATLQSDLSSLPLKVSLGIKADQPFASMLTEGRLYFELDDGAQIDSIVTTQAATVATPDVQIVFLTESHDTRFDTYGHLAPAVESSTPAE